MLIIAIGLAVLGILCLAFAFAIKKYSQNSLNNPNQQLSQTWHKIDQTGQVGPMVKGLCFIGLFFFSAAIAVGFASRGMTLNPLLGIWISLLGAALAVVGGFGYNLLSHPDDPKFMLIANDVRRNERAGSSLNSQKRKMAALLLLGIALIFTGMIVYSRSI